PADGDSLKRKRRRVGYNRKADAMASETLTIIDNRTGKKYEIPIRNGAIKATDLFQIRVGEDDGLVSYDPGFMNTASCQSKITYIDGDRGILRYRGNEGRSEEHTSELQSRENLVCRLLLEKKKKKKNRTQKSKKKTIMSNRNHCHV